MTAKTLMKRHNSKPGVMQVEEQVCSHFLETYHEELKEMNSSEIVSTFEQYIYDLCYD